LFQWVEKYLVRKKGHTNIHAVGRILSRDTSVYTAVRTLRCSPSVHITDIIFHYFWFVCKKYTLMWLVTIWNALNFFATVLRTSLLNSGRPWNSISPWRLDEWCWSGFRQPFQSFWTVPSIGHKSCFSRPSHKTTFRVSGRH